MLRYVNDHYELKWYPAGFFIIEQGEPAASLFLILSGEADVIREGSDGRQEHLATIGTGRFFGEEGIAHRAPRNAHVVAASDVTCLVFSPSEPTAFAGRGEGAALTGIEEDDGTADQSAGAATTVVDVRDQVERKMRALAQYRTQFPLQPDMFPESMMQELLGKEYFVRVIPPPALESDILPS